MKLVQHKKQEAINMQGNFNDAYILVIFFVFIVSRCHLKQNFDESGKLKPIFN